MRKLDLGIHHIDAQPLFLKSSGCLVSSSVAVSRLADYPHFFLDAESLEHMTGLTPGDIDVMEVPAAAKAMESRLAQHVARTYGLGDDGGDLDPELYSSQVLWCNGAAFHEDACFDCVLAVVMWEGEARDLVLPHLGISVAMEPGVVVLLDSAQPHGLLLPGETEFVKERYEHTGARSVFCTLDLSRELEGLVDLMGFGNVARSAPRDAFRLSSTTGVDQRSGRWMPTRYAIG